MIPACFVRECPGSGLRRAAGRGFTLTEMLVVMVVILIGMGTFYGVYVANWSALEQQISRSDIWQDLNLVMEEISFETRHARRVEVARDSDEDTLTLWDAGSRIMVTYTVNDAGQFIMDPGGPGAGDPAEVVLDNVLFDESDFEKVQDGMIVRLTLRDDFMGRFFNVLATTEAYPRN